MGLVSLLLGAGGLMQTVHFYWSIGFIYAGILLLGIEFYFEPWFRKQRWWVRVGGFFVVGVLLALFSLGIVFVPAPLGISAVLTNGEYRPGTTIAGIKWRPQFAEVNVVLANPIARNYEDLNLVLQPDLPVAAIAQVSDISDVSFEDRVGLSVRQVLREGSMSKGEVNPLVLAATDAGYRVRCGRLPPGASLKIVMAVADVKWAPSPPGPKTNLAVMFQRDYLLRVKLSNGSTYWYGHPDGDVYTPRPSPQWLNVYGEYTAGQRRRTVSEHISIVN